MFRSPSTAPGRGRQFTSAFTLYNLHVTVSGDALRGARRSATLPAGGGRRDGRIRSAGPEGDRARGRLERAPARTAGAGLRRRPALPLPRRRCVEGLRPAGLGGV